MPRLFGYRLIGGLVCSFVALGSVKALSSEDCANAFTVIQVQRATVGDAGRIEVFVVPGRGDKPKRHFVTPLLTVGSDAVFVCDKDLLASVASSPGLKPFGRLRIERTPPRVAVESVGREIEAVRERREYLTDFGAESLVYRQGFIEVHDNAVRRLDPGKVPAGVVIALADANGRRTAPDLSGLAFTRWRRFDLDQRVVVADVPLATICAGQIARGVKRNIVGCNMGLYDFNPEDGSLSLVLPSSAQKQWVEQQSGGYSGPWIVGRRIVSAFHRQPEAGWETPVALFESIGADSRGPARQEVLAQFPSAQVRHAQVVWDQLLLISQTEKKGWYFNPESGKFSVHTAPLSSDAVSIPSISYTRDFVLIAENLPARGGEWRSRVLILDKSLQLVDRVELVGHTQSMTTSARPWQAAQSVDGLRLVRRP